MSLKRFFAVAMVITLLSLAAAAQQRADVTVSLNEAFFDSLLESIYQNFEAPHFPMATATADCNESVTILREMNGVRTAARFRNGKIFTPLAFSAKYRAPLIGCVDVAGWAEANVDLEFDREGQRLIGRAKVLRVNLNGTGGVGGSLIARLLQGSIDRKLNPIEIIRLDKMSFAVPVRERGTLQLKAIAVKHEVTNGGLNLIISYDFVKF